ncbi:MAG: EamA family transporter [Polaribacter sp.]|jgi:drug/metabolite transporter (DMT)-like permease|nr:EamA family transporter [Polaribacter sp.]MDA9290006.1 DMT family transporter [Polaribacter sp.]MDB4010853.1 DMT family transporter [Polaribacter sp.]MDB4181507.1 DMT family transporter [Polaribacter sp.]MDG1222724.1 EamA family transporter [Polaribacter sp.]
MQENKLKNYALLHLIVFIWGFTAILGALITIDAVPLVWFRMGLAVLIITIYFLLKKKSFKLDRKGILKFLFTGIIIALHWIFFFKAIKISNVSVALVTMGTGAFFTALIEPFFFKRKIKPIEIILGLMVVFGLYIIFDNFEVAHYKTGIIYASIASFLGALFAVLNGLYIKDYEADVISLYQLLFGVLFVTIYLFYLGSFNAAFFQLPQLDWVYLFILSSICTAYAFIASVEVMKYISPYTVMLTINLEPIYAILLALLIFGEKEKMNPEFYYGAFVVLFVVLLNGILKNKTTLKEKFFRKTIRKN